MEDLEAKLVRYGILRPLAEKQRQLRHIAVLVEPANLDLYCEQLRDFYPQAAHTVVEFPSTDTRLIAIHSKPALSTHAAKQVAGGKVFQVRVRSGILERGSLSNGLKRAVLCRLVTLSL